MRSLIKINLIRLYKNTFYIVACILAFIITYWFMTVKPIPQLANKEPLVSAILLSSGIVFFFSIFAGLFFGNEREDGIIRNKLIAGHSMLTIYFSQYITLCIAMLIMMVFWLVGAIVAGMPINSDTILYTLIAILFNAATLSIIESVVIRVKKQIIGVLASMFIIYIFLQSVFVGNFLNMITYENKVANTIVVVIYNISSIGQCFARSGMGDPEINNTFIQIMVSVIVMVISFLLGTMKLSKTEIN